MSQLLQLIENDDAARREAADALPHAFDQCTYAQGPLRQAIYLCLTCGMDRGVCSACSIACHSGACGAMYLRVRMLADTPQTMTKLSFSRNATLPATAQRAACSFHAHCSRASIYRQTSAMCMARTFATSSVAVANRTTRRLSARP